MAQTVSVIVAAEDRERLLVITGDGSCPLKHVRWARIILLSAERFRSPSRSPRRRRPPCRLALAAAMDVPLDSDVRLMAQRRRRLFLDHHVPQKIRCGVFKSVANLEDAIKRDIKAHNKTSKPFIRTASAAAIFEKLSQTPDPSE